MKIGDDTKTVLLQMPKSAIAYDKCYIPEDSYLQFSLGIHPGVNTKTEEVTFSIFVKRYHPYVVDRGTEIFRDSLKPKTITRDRQWKNYIVDLKEYAGEILEISFNVESLSFIYFLILTKSFVCSVSINLFESVFEMSKSFNNVKTSSN